MKATSFLTSVLMCCGCAMAQAPRENLAPGPLEKGNKLQDRVITGARPLAEVATLLEGKYAKIVTYEDPLWVWPGDLLAGDHVDPTAKWALFPANRSVTLPAVLDSSRNVNQLLHQVVEQFNAQARAPQFKVTEWELGFHIIPTKIHNDGGANVVASNPLDFTISVPIGERTAREHFQQICKAVSAASRIPVEFEESGIRPWLEQLFAAEPVPFTWGGNSMVAREALGTLLLRSATSISWQLRCQPSAAAKDRFCLLSFQPLEVDVVDTAGREMTKVIAYDRCGKCSGRPQPPLPAPPE